MAFVWKFLRNVEYFVQTSSAFPSECGESGGSGSGGGDAAKLLDDYYELLLSAKIWHGVDTSNAFNVSVDVKNV